MWVATAIIGGAVISGVGSYMAQKSAAEEAAGAQRSASESAIAEQRRQQAEAERLLAPYMQAGQGALAQQQALLGLAGPEAQKAASLADPQDSVAKSAQAEVERLQKLTGTGGSAAGSGWTSGTSAVASTVGGTTASATACRSSSTKQSAAMDST
mgnify:CR=1 FL=1